MQKESLKIRITPKSAPRGDLMPEVTALSLFLGGWG